MKTDKLKLLERQKRPLGYAVEKLGRALATPFKEESIRESLGALASINEFLGGANAKETLNRKESEWSSAMHTHFRKYMDGHLSVILYRMISENRGEDVWRSFIKAVAKGCKDKIKAEMVFRNAKDEARRMCNEINSTENVIMEAALNLLSKEEFVNMFDMIKAEI